ncbi:MAG: sulfotransferase [Cyclobacteriaceae bacterium]
MKSPIFIIGAGRSGTNILRDCLTATNHFITWPCDEINLIFRHGNVQFPHDEFGVEQAKPKVINYIRKQFAKQSSPSTITLEKTCANSLRIPFLLKVFPDARFIFLVRNGYDVVSSAKKRWTASPELDYLFQKLKYVPKTDIPIYLLKFLKNRYEQIRSKEGRMGLWGPVYAQMKADVQTESLETICAKQWAACVKKPHEDLLKAKADFIAVTYEHFTKHPEKILNAILEWSDNSINNAELERITSRVNYRPSAKPSAKRISTIIDPIMSLNYEKIRKDCETLI